MPLQKSGIDSISLINNSKVLPVSVICRNLFLVYLARFFECFLQTAKNRASPPLLLLLLPVLMQLSSLMLDVGLTQMEINAFCFRSLVLDKWLSISYTWAWPLAQVTLPSLSAYFREPCGNSKYFQLTCPRRAANPIAKYSDAPSSFNHCSDVQF